MKTLNRLIVLFIVFTFLCKTCLPSFFRPRFPLHTKPTKSLGLTQEFSDSMPPFREMWFTQTLDHFNFHTIPETFQQRYLMTDRYYKPSGPLFFYCGNEGDIEMFWNNTGFQFELAQEFNALVVFAEHRYYGKTMPLGNQSMTVNGLSYCTVEQALADYAKLITWLKNTYPGLQKSKVVAFGGSYGGMLAAWFRIKYPHIVVGALASSAPILNFQDMVDPTAFSHVVTLDYQKVDLRCPKIIHQALINLTQVAQQSGGFEVLTKTFRLCSPIQSMNDVYNLINWIYNGIISMAMTDYPYPTNFLRPLPGWPVTVSCHRLLQTKGLLNQLREVVAVFYNYTGNEQCFNISEFISANLGDAWNYQACTELILPYANNGVTDMFLPSPWNLTQYVEYCDQTYSVHARPFWMAMEYGGINITASSNIIFSNGELDPWRTGSVNKSLSNSLIAIYIAQAAHHLDLRSSNSQDPPSVVHARNRERDIIRHWLNEGSANPN
jgi:lysosomal Pro-X carboxypeptidase